MRTSHYLLATLRQKPTDADIISHQLMLRAGMVRKITSGIYTWLPLGLKVLRKVEAIIREEMNKSGALEILMPAIQPAELWQESSRWDIYGDLMLRMKDRHGRDFCFGPTHEEIITDIIRNEVHSYKQLPLNFYQIQNKFRDELRPRFGLMRAREFLMKDAYSFHLTGESLGQTYELMYQTYMRIFTRLGLNFRAVLADSGDIGGNYSHEFQVLAQSGEDLIAFSDQSDYAANLEKAESLISKVTPSPACFALEKINTPNMRTIEAVVNYLGIDVKKTVKMLLVKGKTCPAVALLLRGDHSLNMTKAGKHPLIASPVTLVKSDIALQLLNCDFGSLGPIGLGADIPLIVDHEAVILSDFVCGANEEGKHFINVNWLRDLPAPLEKADLRNVMAGDLSPDNQGKLVFTRGIEVGHIFQLGDKYSAAMGAVVSNELGENVHLHMGCYGLGVSRIVAAAIEQNYDERGIVWPIALAPYLVALIPIDYENSTVRAITDQLYNDLIQAGIDVLLDDRTERAGVKFADMDLIGIPHRIIIGQRSLTENKVEYKNRKNNEVILLSLATIQTQLNQLLYPS